MYSGNYGEYLDSEVLTAGPVKLVQLLYRGALDAIGAARRSLAAGDIRGRSRSISKASAIIAELSLSLDHSIEPELCRNLVELYDYMLRRLNEANLNQIEQPLVEIEGLLGNLFTAWQQVGREEQGDTPTPAVYAGTGSSEYQRISYAG